MPSRRTLLTVGAGAALAVAVPAGAARAASASASASVSAPGEAAGVTARLRVLEREYGARLGVYARDTATGRTVLYRSDEPFPMCSVFKTLAAAAVMRDLDHDGTHLAKRIHYTQQDVTDAGGGEITKRPENIAGGLTVAELCSAAIAQSDNAAGNLLLRELGGPTAITRFCRSLGDRTTRLDRWEPALNSAEPSRVTDTTSPRAIGQTYARLTLGDALTPGHRERLTGWLLSNTTSGDRLRAGLPRDWAVADKTGAGSYGTNNNVGIAWPPGRPPVVLAILSTKPDAAAPRDNALIADAAKLLADTFA
ncbi:MULTISPECIES: class A beta-lactamase [unclassified Streptomyces]|uniref:class A beta-lactamase n=1 Tax=unclassified Streptomyces TaxID=2593676 RepID=UPI00225A71D4|nr:MULTISPECIES: class A beta-lactamase [unclassified Streptomyces]MCX4524149.1 class A beta-lactamase [Streptomyces sp. NBC_01551]MCX4545332.1 class A beta-lactamase [Streptomyces sp. NBC_01565]